MLAALTAAGELLAGRRLAYAACRPPGHHAGANYYGPFGGTPAKRFYARRLPVGALTDAVDLPGDVMSGLLGTTVDTRELARPVLGWKSVPWLMPGLV